MTKFTPAELNEVFKDMSINEALEAVHPLLYKHSRWHIPGYAPEDVYNELQVIAWRCHQSYERSKGSVINLLTVAFKRRLMNLMKLANKQIPITHFTCAACGAQAIPKGMLRAPVCPKGCTRPNGVKIIMTPQRSQRHVFSIEGRREDSPTFDIVSKDEIGAIDPEADEEWREGLNREEIRLVERALDGNILSDFQKARLQVLLPKVTGKFASSGSH